MLTKEQLLKPNAMKWNNAQEVVPDFPEHTLIKIKGQREPVAGYCGYADYTRKKRVWYIFSSIGIEVIPDKKVLEWLSI